MKTVKQKEIDELFAVIVQLESMEECRKFLRDLLTETEIREFAERWKVARMLSRGIPYTRIENETGLSSRTRDKATKCATYSFAPKRDIAT